MADMNDESAHRTPRWVKVSLIVALVLVSVFAIAMLAGIGGEHGPGRHKGPGGGAPSSDIGEHSPPPNHGG